jgi:biopolymer transport protein ExbD
MRRRAKKSRNGPLDITPLVDLVFLLIIFFLLSTTFVVYPGIRVDLPHSISQKIHKDSKEISITVDQGGIVYLEREAVDTSSLGPRLAQSARERPDAVVLIRGDRGAGFGVVSDVLGVVKQAGLHRIAIMTRSQKGLSKDSDPPHRSNR